ncbi:MAG: hypothetical protein KIS77_11145 [Saprospiraceae bacterium]|nr:hypothetical protein [Saprospiraceae bacterium]
MSRVGDFFFANSKIRQPAQPFKIETPRGRAVQQSLFLVENAYYENVLSFDKFERQIDAYAQIANQIYLNSSILYDKPDKARIQMYYSVFTLMTDTIAVKIDSQRIDTLMPFYYDFDDIFGSGSWSKMFVTKLLATHEGNCHSMPFFYKMICSKLNIPCHLALAPNHIYIKHRAQKGGWYNTELTSATFPIDAWLMASGYISLQSVQNGIYLDTLSEKENIALCVLDLAQGYNHKYPDNDGNFVIECCDLALKHFPDYVNAILLKAETRLKQLQAMQKEMKYAYLKDVTAMPEGKAKWDEMNSLYMQLYKLGYRQMPEQMYVEWLTSLKTEKEKYSNKNAPGAKKD